MLIALSQNSCCHRGGHERKPIPMTTNKRGSRGEAISPSVPLVSYRETLHLRTEERKLFMDFSS